MPITIVNTPESEPIRRFVENERAKAIRKSKSFRYNLEQSKRFVKENRSILRYRRKGFVENFEVNGVTLYNNHTIYYPGRMHSNVHVLHGAAKINNKTYIQVD